jgi:hypothetical protein
MTLTRDSRAPKELSDDQKSELEQDPQFQEMLQQKEALGMDILFKFGSFPKAKGTNILQQHTKVSKEIQSLPLQGWSR